MAGIAAFLSASCPSGELGGPVLEYADAVPLVRGAPGARAYACSTSSDAAKSRFPSGDGATGSLVGGSGIRPTATRGLSATLWS